MGMTCVPDLVQMWDGTAITLAKIEWQPPFQVQKGSSMHNQATCNRILDGIDLKESLGAFPRHFYPNGVRSNVGRLIPM